ncbi:DUF2325 domain-containing protein [Brevibacillus marinus]|uniref:DUF2325 domain-containing protein n=1 Tax=Brevibacillus marinus TaxID=2496837 RepID=UPI000F837693|nr:DUF2325 domain-containing protein [Brevibacillus marinus]
MKTVAIIGGSQKCTFEKIGRELGFKVLFHDAKVDRKKNGMQELRRIIKYADCVIVLQGACCHRSMWAAKDFAKELSKPIAFQKGFGASGALELAKTLIA